MITDNIKINIDNNVRCYLTVILFYDLRVNLRPGAAEGGLMRGVRTSAPDD